MLPQSEWQISAKELVANVGKDLEKRGTLIHFW